MKLSPGLAVISTTMRSERTLVPPVTELRLAAGLADDGCGLAGDGGLVDAGDAFDDVAVARDDLAGHHDHPVAELELGGGDVLHGTVALQPVRNGLGLGPAQAGGLRLATAFGHRPRRGWRRRR